MKLMGRWLAALALCLVVTIVNPAGALGVTRATAPIHPFTGDGDPASLFNAHVAAPTGTGTLTLVREAGNPYNDETPPSVQGVAFKVAKVTGVTLATAQSWQDIKSLTPEKVADKLDSPVTQSTDSNGRAVFDHLSVGLYLISQEQEHASGKIAPFLITVPVADKTRHSWNYRLVITPKPQPRTPTGSTSGSGTGPYVSGEVSKDTTPTPTPSESKSPTPTADPNPGNGNKTYSANKDHNKQEPPVKSVWLRAPNGDLILVAPDGTIMARLPATGVIVAQVGGMALFLIGVGMWILLRTKRRQESQDAASVEALHK